MFRFRLAAARLRAGASRAAAAAMVVGLLSSACTSDDALSEVPSDQIEVAEAYVTQLNALVGVLSVIDDESDAREAVPKIEASVAEIGVLYVKIQRMPPKSRRAIRQHFAGRFEFANRKINEQAVRVLAKAETGRSLRNPLAPVAKYLR